MNWRLLAAAVLLACPGPVQAGFITVEPARPDTQSDIRFFANATGPIAWDFGDGQSGQGNPIHHRYTFAGLYTATASRNGTAVDTVAVLVRIPGSYYIANGTSSPSVAPKAAAEEFEASPVLLSLGMLVVGAAGLAALAWRRRARTAPPPADLGAAEAEPPAEAPPEMTDEEILAQLDADVPAEPEPAPEPAPPPEAADELADEAELQRQVDGEPARDPGLTPP